MLRIDYAYVTHTGLCRKKNQDNLFCNGIFLPPAHGSLAGPVSGTAGLSGPALFGVFDGMGGEEHGEAASFLAAETAASGQITGAAGLKSFCFEANRRICDYVKEKNIRSSGTTASLLLFSPREIVSCHIGDSRIYRLDHNGQLNRLTKDDVWPSFSGRKHMLLQCLGIPEEEMRISPHLDHYPLSPGSVFLICSDGLTNMLPEVRIRETVSRSTDLEQQAGTLLEQALDAGGTDNVTLLLVRVSGTSSH